jgi:threonine/homoserine/homoserine lactone efflux protein
MTDPLLFFVAVVTLLATPGPTNTLLATSGALSGFRRSLPLLAAELAGYLLAVCLIGLVLRPVLLAVPLLAISLKVVVAVYLLNIAWKLWRRGATPDAVGVVSAPAMFVATLLNPKAIIFSLGILPFGHPGIEPYLAGFSVLVVCLGAIWIGIGRAAGIAAGARHARHLPRIASVILTAFAGVIFASAFG